MSTRIGEVPLGAPVDPLPGGQVRSGCSATARDAPMSVICSRVRDDPRPWGRTVADAQQMAELGVDRLVVAIRSKDIEDVRDELARFGDEVIGPTTEW